MSERWNDGTMERNTATSANAANFPIRRSIFPTFHPSVLPSICHPPDLSAHVVADEERSVRHDEETDRATPARAIGKLPSNDEVLDPGRSTTGAVHAHADDFGAGWHGSVPGAVQRHEGVAAVVAGKLVARVEREPQRRRMRLHGDDGRLDFRAVGRAVLGIGLAGEVALRPAVVAAFLDDVDVLGRQIVPEIVAIVIPAPELAGRRVKGDPDGVPQSLREKVPTRSVGIETSDRGPERIALIANIARRTDRDVELAVGSEHDRPRRMAPARNIRHDGHRVAAAGIVPFY